MHYYWISSTIVVRMKTFLSILLSSIFVPISTCKALDLPGVRGPLKPGMTEAQVESLWGAPGDKVERESQHDAIWHYPAFKSYPAVTLRFVEGGLRVNAEMHKPAGVRPTSQFAAKKSRSEKPRSFMALEDEKVLEEILQEVPNEPDSPGGGPAAPKNPMEAVAAE